MLPALAPSGELLDVVGGLPEEARRVVLVGHEPDLGRLASLLVSGDPDVASIELKKGGVLLLDRDRERGRATFKWHAPPQLLRRLA